jgi:hypothetical protein
MIPNGHIEEDSESSDKESNSSIASVPEEDDLNEEDELVVA